jgi:hypothetical protein
MKHVYSMDFEKLWCVFPTRGPCSNPKHLAYKKWCERLRQGIEPETLIRCAENYAVWCRVNRKEGTEFVMQASTFLGPDRRWADYMPKTPPEGSQAQAKAVLKEPEERVDGRPFIKEIIEKLASKRIP